METNYILGGNNMSVKMLTIILLWILGMVIDAIWCFSDKEQMTDVYEGISDLVDEGWPKGLIIGMLIIIVVILSATWPSDLVTYPYKQLKKYKKSS